MTYLTVIIFPRESRVSSQEYNFRMN
jgi:hypothetical protein